MPVRYVVNRIKRFFIYRVLHVDDTPHRIALGVAIGIFVTWTPTIGLQMVLTVALAWLLRANMLVGVPFVWISNPLTLLPIYGTNTVVGAWLVGNGTDCWGKIAAATQFRGGLIAQMQAWWEATWEIFWPLWLGSIIVGLTLGAILYPLTYYLVIAYRRHYHRVHPDRKSLGEGTAPPAP